MNITVGKIGMVFIFIAFFAVVGGTLGLNGIAATIIFIIGCILYVIG